MNRIIRFTLSAVLAGLAATSVGAPAQTSSEPTCQRACLEGWVNRYLEAMRDGNVDPTLFARDVKFTENGIQLPLGRDGLWFAMSGIGNYKFYIPDIETQQVAFLGTVKEESGARSTGPMQERLVAIALRLKIANDRIVEIEQLAERPEISLFGPSASTRPFPETGVAVEAMKEPNSIFRETIPVKERASREELIKTANHYFAGLQRNDGKGTYPFTDDCDRFENGIPVLANVLDPDTNTRGRMSCKRQFEVALKNVVSRIRDRRFVAVDRERGIVFAFAFFDHHTINWTWQLGELFKIEKGKIRRIEAVFGRAPFGINSGWSTYEQGMSEEIQSVR